MVHSMWGVYHRYQSITIVTRKPWLRVTQLRSRMEAALTLVMLVIATSSDKEGQALNGRGTASHAGSYPNIGTSNVQAFSVRVRTENGE